MKIIILLFATILFGNCLLFAQEKPAEKPPLTEQDLEKYTSYFQIADNKLIGDGAKFLTNEIIQNQFVILGEYHGSSEISKFTKAIIPIFHDAGCRTFGLEIGPISAQILAKLSKDSSKTIENLKAFNSENLVPMKTRSFTPIPFFSNVEDAEFLMEARKRNWNLLGLDQEFSFSYIPLFQTMFDNLKWGKQAELKPLFDKIITSIPAFYEADSQEKMSQYKAILESKEINNFLASASIGNPKNKQIADAIKFTTEIYYQNDRQIRRYYDANSSRVNYMKNNLSEGFRKIKFDQTKDKMLLKMGAVHTGRGFSPLSLFEIGNTLSELAVFNGNRSLHIEFGSRYFIENGKEVDALSNEKGFLYRYQAFLQMSKKDKWTVIDLRPLRNTVFYQRKFNLDSIVLEIFKNQDLYVMPPVDKDPTPNYQTK